jgi:hypothetical protein
MGIRIQWTRINANDVATSVGFVNLFAGDGVDVETSKEWISARVTLDETSVKSLALLQIAAVRKVRDLLTDESERLGRLYRESDKSQR